jgi:hypothetical protein
MDGDLPVSIYHRPARLRKSLAASRWAALEVQKFSEFGSDQDLGIRALLK